MSNIIFRTSSIETIKELNATQIKILLSLADLSKNNQVLMDNNGLKKISEMLDIEAKTVLNNLRGLVKQEVIVKVGTLQDYVINPSIIITGNEDKCIKNYNAAISSVEEFKKHKKETENKARGNYQTKQLEGLIESKKREQLSKDSKLIEEAKQRFDNKK